VRNLILCGGIFHDFEASAREVAAVLAEVGIDSEIVVDLDAALEVLRAGALDLFTVQALRWPMLEHEKYAPYRAQWATHMDADRGEPLRAFVAGGGGLLALHTASICFGDWPEWRRMLGGAWVWGRSHHPPDGPAHVRRAAAAEGPVAGLAAGIPGDGFAVEDEVYHDLDVDPAVTPLLEATVAGADDYHLVAWAHRYGGGRVVCDLLGHDLRSLRAPAHRDLLARSARWLAGADR
jgi:type 1 glutamine amidotransferase